MALEKAWAAGPWSGNILLDAIGTLIGSFRGQYSLGITRKCSYLAISKNV